MFIWRWLRDVPLDDPVERKLAPLLQLILIAVIGALGVAIVDRILRTGFGGIPVEGLVAAGVFVVISLGTLALVRRGQFKVAAWGFFLLIYVLAIRRLVNATPEKADEALMTFFLPLTVAGLFLNRRALIPIVAITCVLVFIPGDNQKIGADTASSFIINVVLVCFLLDMLGNTLRSELKAALVRNQELEQARQALETSGAELFRANERLTTTLKSIGDAVITTDAQGRILLINTVAQRLTGWTQAEAGGQSLATVFHILNENTREIVESPVDKVMREGVVVGLANHTVLIAKDGEEIPIDDSGAPIIDSSGKIAGVVLVFRDITERKQIEIQEKEQVAVAERQRLARELHDSVSQTLFTANIIAESLPRLAQRNPEKSLQQLEQLHQLTQGAAAEMRSLLLELRPESVVNTGMEELLNQLCHAIQARRKINVTVSITGETKQPLPQDVHLTFYRIAQESFNNIARHANAKQARVRLIREADQIELIIVDNGDGFDTKSISSGFGLTSMRERAENIHASLRIQSKIGMGTRMKLQWKGVNESAAPIQAK
jgi:PAS domain S-box-containing protein